MPESVWARYLTLFAASALLLSLTWAAAAETALAGPAASPAAAAVVRPELDLRVGHNGAIEVVTFYPDGKTLASAGGDQVKLWDAATGELRRTLMGHRGTVNALAALAANGGNVKRTARELGLPHRTLLDWKRETVPAAVAEKQAQKKGELADQFEALIWQAVGILPDKMPEATAAQLTTCVGILTDKMRLLREQATAIHEQRMSREEAVSELTQILDCAREKAKEAETVH